MAKKVKELTWLSRTLKATNPSSYSQFRSLTSIRMKCWSVGRQRKSRLIWEEDRGAWQVDNPQWESCMLRCL